jgi:hypothetical protein
MTYAAMQAATSERGDSARLGASSAAMRKNSRLTSGSAGYIPFFHKVPFFSEAKRNSNAGCASGAINASNSRLTAGKARLRLFGGPVWRPCLAARI